MQENTAGNMKEGELMMPEKNVEYSFDDYPSKFYQLIAEGKDKEAHAFSEEWHKWQKASLAQWEKDREQGIIVLR